ncbi:MAG: flippase-like domain-containing protein [Filimonas sp.]|nr:flippase-like domain-containing protein [Filimonas sp.]
MEKNKLLKRRYKILLNYIVGPILFIALSWSIYQKIKHQANLQASWYVIRDVYKGPQKWYFWGVVALSIVNWGVEARKWQVLIRSIQKISLFKAFRAVLSGLALSLFVPNRVGEYLGRVLYMDEGNRLRSIALTVVGGISQLIITLVAGIAGLFYLRTYILTGSTQMEGLSVFWLDGLMYAVVVGTILLILLYYKLSWITLMLEKVPFISKYKYFIQNVEDFHWKELTRILSLSAGRFIVFIIQYMLMLKAFNVNIGLVDGGWTICVLFLVLAIIPTMPMAELGVRGQASIQLFGLLSTNTVGIIATAAGIWCINLIIPALAGSLFILGIKLFKKA